MYVCVYACVRACVRACACVHVCVLAYVRACMQACMRACLRLSHNRSLQQHLLHTYSRSLSQVQPFVDTVLGILEAARRGSAHALSEKKMGGRVEGGRAICYCCYRDRAKVVCVCACVCARACVCACACAYVCVYACVCEWECMCVCAYLPVTCVCRACCV